MIENNNDRAEETQKGNRKSLKSKGKCAMYLKWDVTVIPSRRVPFRTDLDQIGIVIKIAKSPDNKSVDLILFLILKSKKAIIPIKIGSTATA